MIVLADTSVWSLALRRKKSAILNSGEQRLMQLLSEAMQEGRIRIIGPIRQELLSGIKDQAQFDRLKAKLDAFRDEPLETADYEHAARLYNAAMAHGIRCGTIDILICAVALRREWEVLSNDSGLNRCLQAIRAN
jgi:predicted nucleic acid-binding protein